MATANSTVKPMKSKSQLAAEYAKEHGVSIYAAAKLFDVGSQSVYRYIQRIEDTTKPRCPCCHQILPAA